ncbi:conjugal transfer protein TraA (plasmid) [Roseomonas gilardii]|uniref:Conjugal transfer protein TraA n=1 Tax=Roseomonas gilardii TaxID=257708 RepID=A0A1L7ANI2_9PROT|nr:MobF family relaxase [Roseomonas gilardii]APT60333.1 conjugal transfer protein TraA [Roseomonas gilardii]
MMTFRKLSAAGSGKLLRAYFTENSPEPARDPATTPGRHLDPGGRLTAYYTGRDSRASWRPDMPRAIANALGIDTTRMPKDEALDRLFEARRADTGEAWSGQKREISAYDLTLAPHKSVSLAAEFAATPAERAAIWYAIDRANDATMRYVARELGWARKGKGGSLGADPGAVAWVSFRHHTARPTVTVRDGKAGPTYLAEVTGMAGDPHAHIHNALFNAVVTEDGRVGSLDTQRLHARVHEFGAYFQARLADHLRELGARVSYDRQQQAVVLDAIPQAASDLFSKGRRQVERSARAYASSQGLDWDTLSAEGKFKILATSGLAARLDKNAAKGDRETWLAQAEVIGWRHVTVMEEVERARLPDAERLDRAYRFAARHLATEFHTAAVIDHDRLRLHAARGLIGTGIGGGTGDIDRVVELIEQRGITLRGEHVALLVGLSGDKVRVTNTAQLRLEESLQAQAHRAARDRSGALPAAAITAAIDAALRAGRIDLTREPAQAAAQRAAIYALGQGGALSMLTGVAGAGKTTLLQPLVAAWKADTRFGAGGREVIGVATAWRQASALGDAGIEHTVAMDPLLRSIEAGRLVPTRNTVLVIDEVSQVAPRALLTLLEVQARTGMTIKVLGDREQAQSVEAGDAVELMRRALPRAEQAEILDTVRQASQEDRHIAGLFREGQAAEALALKRARGDGSARLLGGDQDQVVEQIADLYMARRDALLAAGSKLGVTVSAPTNEDVAEISRAIRGRMKARGEIGADEVAYQAIDQRGETYDLPIATGDKVRLFSRTWATLPDGKHTYIGANGDVLTVVGQSQQGLRLRNKDGLVGDVEWRRLRDRATGRLQLGFGHALTVDAAQGITSAEHIDALPRGTAGVTAFKGYVAESRARGTTWTLISEAATFEAIKRGRALGDATPITSEDLWAKAAEGLSQKPYKPLGSDLLDELRASREKATSAFIRFSHRMEMVEHQGRDFAREVRDHREAMAIQAEMPRNLAALDEALRQMRGGAVTPAEEHLRRLRVETEVARREIEASVRPSSPSAAVG